VYIYVSYGVDDDVDKYADGVHIVAVGRVVTWYGCVDCYSYGYNDDCVKLVFTLMCTLIMVDMTMTSLVVMLMSSMMLLIR